MIRIALKATVTILAVATSGLAQDGPRVVKMTVSPASESKTRIVLLPELRDMKPGNAAVFYQRAQSLEWWGPSIRKPVEEAIASLEKPWRSNNLTAPRFESFGPLGEIDLAARCELCDWQMLDRIRTDAILLQIPDVQAMRNIGALNSVRTRSQIHLGQFDKATRGLQTQFAMAKHVGEQPIIISYLVGTAISSLGQSNLEEWIQQPDARSLYWALTDLPQPLIDLRRPLQGEAIMFDAVLPEIRHALKQTKPDPIPVRVLRDRIQKFFAAGQMVFDTAQIAAAMAHLHPQARAHFTAKNWSSDEMDRLPVTQLVMMFLAEVQERRSGEILKIQNLPYWQAQSLWKKIRIQRESDPAEDPILSRIASIWEPAFHSIFKRRAELERRFAMLRQIEALRLYAAENRGEWPDSLNDIRDLPLPVDPFTGKEFHYRREGKVAIVEALAPPGLAPGPTTSTRYELTLRSKNAN